LKDNNNKIKEININKSIKMHENGPTIDENENKQIISNKIQIKIEKLVKEKEVEEASKEIYDPFAESDPSDDNENDTNSTKSLQVEKQQHDKVTKEIKQETILQSSQDDNIKKEPTITDNTIDTKTIVESPINANQDSTIKVNIKKEKKDKEEKSSRHKSSKDRDRDRDRNKERTKRRSRSRSRSKSNSHRYRCNNPTTTTTTTSGDSIKDTKKKDSSSPKHRNRSKSRSRERYYKTSYKDRDKYDKDGSKYKKQERYPKYDTKTAKNVRSKSRSLSPSHSGGSHNSSNLKRSIKDTSPLPSSSKQNRIDNNKLQNKSSSYSDYLFDQMVEEEKQQKIDVNQLHLPTSTAPPKNSLDSRLVEIFGNNDKINLSNNDLNKEPSKSKITLTKFSNSLSSLNPATTASNKPILDDTKIVNDDTAVSFKKDEQVYDLEEEYKNVETSKPVDVNKSLLKDKKSIKNKVFFFHHLKFDNFLKFLITVYIN
jgi:hypothetical protein